MDPCSALAICFDRLPHRVAMEFSSVSVRVTVADSFFALLPAFSARWRIHGSFISDSNSGSSFPIRFQYMLTRRSTRKARPLSRPTKPSNVDRAPWPSATATARDLLPSSTRRPRPRDAHPRTRNDRLPQEEAHRLDQRHRGLRGDARHRQGRLAPASSSRHATAPPARPWRSCSSAAQRTPPTALGSSGARPADRTNKILENCSGSGSGSQNGSRVSPVSVAMNSSEIFRFR